MRTRSFDCFRSTACIAARERKSRRTKEVKKWRTKQKCKQRTTGSSTRSIALESALYTSTFQMSTMTGRTSTYARNVVTSRPFYNIYGERWRGARHLNRGARRALGHSPAGRQARVAARWDIRAPALCRVVARKGGFKGPDDERLGRRRERRRRRGVAYDGLEEAADPAVRALVRRRRAVVETRALALRNNRGDHVVVHAGRVDGARLLDDAPPAVLPKHVSRLGALARRLCTIPRAIHDFAQLPRCLLDIRGESQPREKAGGGEERRAEVCERGLAVEHARALRLVEESWGKDVRAARYVRNVRCRARSAAVLQRRLRDRLERRRRVVVLHDAMAAKGTERGRAGGGNGGGLACISERGGGVVQSRGNPRAGNRRGALTWKFSSG